MTSPSPLSWSHEQHPQLLSHDDYIDLRNVQDHQLKVEFTSVRCSIDLVRQELKSDIGFVKAQTQRLEDQTQRLEDQTQRLEDQTQRLEAQNQRLEAQNQRLEAQIRQSHAYMRNNALKNPTLPIRPVVVYRPEQGILEPELSRFPRNANEFYSLRDPQTNRHRSVLAYLAAFYDVQIRTAEYPSEDDSSGDDETFLDRPDVIVEKLEDILGLNEDKFVKFRERARQLAAQSPSKPVKRSQIFIPDEESIPRPRRQRLELRPIGAEDERPHTRDNGGRQSPKSASSEGLTNARLGWGTRSTPSSRRLRINRTQEPEPVPVTLEPQPETPKSDSEITEPKVTVSDSQTHAFTSPREP
ncbi:hypothetical protein CSHISOI_04423 [Colletotrichum shisoi]|uniref:Uncharacterized protein n=1 Tax=Colletotrichum shisoi TaxID=2078593 RepID=A0A5Q4BVN0_9PEZI|nr:hypothetical protein CSHISOI_04423 [Colletotrichum shisoi]